MSVWSRNLSYEMAFKMQTEATDAFDLSKEPASIKRMYGETNQGRQMIIARRLIERGVRCVQVFHGGWDHHNGLANAVRQRAGEIDKPLAAFMTDLKQRGLFDSTIVQWTGEFGRADSQNLDNNEGRDHNSRRSACGWLAAASEVVRTTVRPTLASCRNKVHIHDLHATLLQLMGFNHKALTYRYNGRDFRLTDNFGNVLKKLIA